ncbi:probable rRNA-processing protein EBP2 [Spea bombifrons]|uniref:probable rRNA-processing protein EBP2 n=1 Tax=Spea bombifrons TaxID=233779 RepID=UPI00234A2AF2|nr:probable rRNA-processing protein EBP2 [Spea bombifrons]XP_053325346.1 probable rRNA-processing protein EBP2 [Spea bombifrons]
MSDFEEDNTSASDSDIDPSELTEKELQEAFSQGKIKPGLNVVLEGKKKSANDISGLKQSLLDLKNDFPWVERLDVTEAPVPETPGQSGETAKNPSDVNAEDDFQREICFYRQAQAAVLFALPRLLKLKVATRRPDDYFAEMAKTDQHMQKIRHKLQSKQAAMEKSEKAKQLRALRKYGKKVQTEVLQKRQKEKSAMMTQVKKYQKGLSDKLDFLEGDQPQKKASGSAVQKKKGPNAKRRYKDEKFGFGGRKKGSKRNTKESVNDVPGFRKSAAHGRGPSRPGKKGGKNANKRPGKSVRQKIKNKGR